MRVRAAVISCSLAGALAVQSATTAARAEATDQDKALASTLFDEAKVLLAGGQVGAACRKLEESRRLNPLPGTLLNLAVCHEEEGLLASAYAELREARALAERDQRADRVTLADEHMRAIEPRMSALVVLVGPEADTPGLAITRDGTPIGRPAWGGRMPVNPGEHVLEASAPGKKSWKITVAVGANADVKTVTLAQLEDLKTAAPIPVVPEHVPEPAREEATHSAGGLSARREAALAVVGAGVAAIGVGAYFGVRAIGYHGDPGAICTTNPCSQPSVTLNNEAKLAADVSTVTLILGAAGLATGSFLWFWPTSKAPETRLMALVPTLGPGGGGVQFGGSF